MNDNSLINSITLTIPRIGAEWPGQGGIFAGITGGREGQPFFALILSTDPRADFEMELGTYDQDVKGATSKSDGMANTLALAAAGSALCNRILALDIDGHQDWFLPAADDARVLCANVPELFETESWYWTSTQYGRYYAFVQDFEYGDHTIVFKGTERRARAIRKIQRREV